MKNRMNKKIITNTNKFIKELKNKYPENVTLIPLIKGANFTIKPDRML